MACGLPGRYIESRNTEFPNSIYIFFNKTFKNNPFYLYTYAFIIDENIINLLMWVDINILMLLPLDLSFYAILNTFITKHYVCCE